MSALLLGSISTVADTSELQRQAYNQAFAEHGLDWRWDQDDYRAMLATSGGQSRIAGYARSRGQDADAKAIHETKSKIFQDSLATAGLAPRPGVAAAIRAARSRLEGRLRHHDVPRQRRGAARGAEPAGPGRGLRRHHRRLRHRPAQAGPGRLRVRAAEAGGGRRRGHRRRGQRGRRAGRGRGRAALCRVPQPEHQPARLQRAAGVAASSTSATCSGWPAPSRRRHDGGPGPALLTATDTAFHVEAYEKIDYSLLYVDGAFAVQNTQIADSYRPFGRCLMVVDETVYRLYGEQMHAYFDHHGSS